MAPERLGPGHRPALEMPDGRLDYRRLRTASAALSDRLVELGGGAGGRARQRRPPGGRPIVVAVPAVPRLGTVVAILAGLRAGVAVLPVNVGAGSTELRHVVDDACPAAVVAPADLDAPDELASLPRIDVDLDPLPEQAGPDGSPPVPLATDPALVVYTSGTTGPPKGVVLSHGALAADLDALAVAWQLRPNDLLVHALPLFHVHGLVLATLGPLRIGAEVVHLGRFDPAAVADRFRSGASVLYGVPTMYHRLADAIDDEPSIGDALTGARLLVSGSAGLPAHDRRRITTAVGLPVLERYGMTETLITCAMTVDGAGEPGTVGPPLPGVELRLVDDQGAALPGTDHGSVGEIQVRGRTMFSGYLDRPEATAACWTDDGWFRTGDLGTWAAGGAVRISGRRSVDLIKSGGYRIGAGEVENALLGHPGVAEVAVRGVPDEDLGERVVAWVVPVRTDPPTADELIDHVAAQLSGHKRPRVVRFVESLPRNELGKVRKQDLVLDSPA